jgi:pimeloyl-ACP methyl ester carboxylesterase
MQSTKQTILIILFWVGSLSAFAQTRIIQDSLMFTLTSTQIDSILLLQGIPSGIVGTEYTVGVHKLIFKTLNYDSTPTYASGLAMIPTNVNYCKLPIVSYQHGTIVRKRDVPSRWAGQEKLISLILASNGLISIMPDYHGMGDGPGIHPYQNARTEAFSVVDMIRATKEVCDTLSIGYGDQLFLFGYSQGGHATMAAHKMIQEQLAGEMHVTASAPMSGAYDMSGVQTDLLLAEKPYSDPYYLPFLIFGNNPIYNFFTDPAEVLKQPYATTLPPLMNGVANANTINNAMNDTVKRIFRDDLLDSFNQNPNHFFKQFLRDNDVYQWVPTSPMVMYFCTLDEKVPFQNTYKALAYFKQNGALNVDTVNSGALLHTDCAQPSFLNAKFWIDSYRTKAMKLLVGSQNATNGNANGTAIVNIEGGLTPFVIRWSNGDTTASITNLAAGNYTATVTDANGCAQTKTVTVGLTNGIDNLTLGAIALYPNPTTNSITLSIEKMNSETSVKIFDVMGKLVYASTITTEKTILPIESFVSGVYTAQIGQTTFKKFIKQ